jgi:hypothetical protein
MAVEDYRVAIASQAASGYILLGDREYTITVDTTPSGTWAGGSAVALQEAGPNSSNFSNAINPNTGEAYIVTAPGSPIKARGPLKLRLNCTTHSGTDSITLSVDPPTAQ